MSLAFLTSWRAAFLGAGLVTLAVIGWNLAFGPDTATRVAEARMEALFPGGEASDDILDRAVVADITLTDLGITLREVVALFSDATVTYEPFDPRIFVIRLKMTNQMTREPLELALRFVVADGPEGYGSAARFTGRSVLLDHAAVNRLEATQGEALQLIADIRALVLAKRTGAPG